MNNPNSIFNQPNQTLKLWNKLGWVVELRRRWRTSEIVNTRDERSKREGESESER